MEFRSTRFPELRVCQVGVKFRGGVASVETEAAVEFLLTLGDMGVEPVEVSEADEAEEVEPVEAAVKRGPGRPRKS
jgi:hypothetical protein